MEKGPFKILLVDDDEDDYIMTRDLLAEIKGPRYEMEWVSTYNDALAAIKRNKHDIYFLDYRLGERTGLELLKETIANGCKKPMILLTGQGDHEIDIEAMKAGAADYLVKGKIDAPLLERSIRYAMERKQSEEQMLRIAYYDSLTGLPNRLLFKDRLKQCMAHARCDNKLAAVLFLDLDNFKHINDTLGHDVGDLLLKKVAQRLMNCVRETDSITHQNLQELNISVSRLGGDEFTIILNKITKIHNAAKAAQRILETLSQSFVLNNNEVFISVSIGITIYPTDGEDIDTLLKNADTAMYEAKSQGKNNYQFYKQNMNATALERLTLESNLRKALDRGEFLLYYQPQMDGRTGKIDCMEALIRWQHPYKGMVSPEHFIPLAEELGLIIPFGEWVLRAACAQNKIWQTMGFGPLHISVNLSSQQFKQQNLPKSISNILKDLDLEPDNLELEITESIFMENAEPIIAQVHELKKMGIRLTMDDFGTGFSSFNYLRRMPLDMIKIDRSFVKDITVNPSDAAIVKAIIAMSHTLKLDVVAEGVETEEQLLFLLEHGCDKIQGYLLGRPVSAEDATRFLKEAKEGKHIELIRSVRS
jgi:diguanylate cyclase (GGDEF)-like protein